MRRITAFFVATLFLGLGSFAQARTPYGHQVSRLDIVAYKLVKETADLYRNAEYAIPHYSYEQRNALKNLARLNHSARAFANDLQRHPYSPEYSRSEFTRLYRSFQNAADSLHCLSGHRFIGRDFQQVRVLVRALTNFYGTPDYHTYGRPGGSIWSFRR